MKYRLEKIHATHWRVLQAAELGKLRHESMRHLDEFDDDQEWLDIITPEAERIGQELTAIAEQVGINCYYQVKSNRHGPDDNGYIFLGLSLRVGLTVWTQKELEGFIVVAALNDYDCINQEQVWKQF